MPMTNPASPMRVLPGGGMIACAAIALTAYMGAAPNLALLMAGLTLVCLGIFLATDA